MIARLRWMAMVAGVAWGFVAPLFAQNVPNLASASRTWFQRGTTNEVILTGDALAGIGHLHFTGTGLTGEPAPKGLSQVVLEGSLGGLSVGPVELGKNLTVQVAVASDAPLGRHEVRVAGPDGVSNPVAVYVSDLPEWLEQAPDHQLSEAPLYPTPSAISGVIRAAAESDYLRFKLIAGTKVIFDLQANRFGSPLDATLFLLDSAGKELGRSEDVHGLDPFLEFTPPVDGDYVVRVVDTRYQGGDDYRYRLVAGVVPYLDYLFPFGGRRGSSITVHYFGHNLEGADQLSLHVAADAPLGRQDLRARTPLGYSNPRPFEVDEFPEFNEAEPNNANDQANAITVPMVINGSIGEAGDRDTFRVRSSVDQRVIAEVQARPFGSALDAFLTLSDAAGGVLAKNDDANGPDARIEFEAKKDVDYLLSLRDLTDRGGDRFGYRLVIHSTNRKPDFSVRTSGGRFKVNRGGTTAIRCEVERRDGFDGTVRFTGEGLPQGITVSPLTLGPTLNYGWLILTASSGAALGNVPLSLTAYGEVEGKAVLKPVQFSESGWLTVLPNAPFGIDLAESTVEAEQNSEASIQVSVVRHAGFNGEIKLSAEGIDGVQISPITLSGGEFRGKLTLRASYNAPIGVRPLMIRGEASWEGSKAVQYAPSTVPVMVHGIEMFLTAMLPGSPFFRTDEVKLSAVALPTNTVSAANSTEFVVKVDRRGVQEEIALEIEGLPKGILATVSPIAAHAKEATVKLQVTDQAETGKEVTFSVQGRATYKDRIWRQNTQPVKLFVAAPEKNPGAEAAQASAQSPVENSAVAK